MDRERVAIGAFVMLVAVALLSRCDPTSSFSFHPKPAPAKTEPQPGRVAR